MNSQTGVFFLIPSLLGEGEPGRTLPSGNLDIIRELKYFIVEEIKTARRFLRVAGISGNFEDIHFLIFNEHTQTQDLKEFIQPMLDGHDVGLISEAGLPCIADPGSALVSLAHENNIKVVPLSGPSSIFLALMASGFNGQNFSFSGYLPIDKNKRIQRIRELENRAYRIDQTQIFIETPYRNLQLFQAILQTCKPETKLCLATQISANDEAICVKSIREWKNSSPELHKRPTVFLLYR